MLIGCSNYTILTSEIPKFLDFALKNGFEACEVFLLFGAYFFEERKEEVASSIKKAVGEGLKVLIHATIDYIDIASPIDSHRKISIEILKEALSFAEEPKQNFYTLKKLEVGRKHGI